MMFDFEDYIEVTTLTGKTVTLKWEATIDRGRYGEGFSIDFFTEDEEGYTDENIDLEAMCGYRYAKDAIASIEEWCVDTVA